MERGHDTVIVGGLEVKECGGKQGLPTWHQLMVFDEGRSGVLTAVNIPGRKKSVTAAIIRMSVLSRRVWNATSKLR